MPRAALGGQVALVAPGRHDDEPVHAPVAERRDELTLAHRILVDTAGQHDNAALVRDVLDGSMQGGREGVGDVFQQQPDSPRPAVRPTQTAGGQVRPVVQTLSSVLDA